MNLREQHTWLNADDLGHERFGLIGWPINRSSLSMQFGLFSGRHNTNNKAPAVPELSILSPELCPVPGIVSPEFQTCTIGTGLSEIFRVRLTKSRGQVFDL